MKPAPKNLPAKNAKTTLYARSKKTIRRRDLQCRYYMNRLIATAPWIERQDAMLLRRFVQLEMLGDRVYSALRDGEIVTGRGESKRLLQDFRRLVATQASLAAQLGLSPVARRALKDDASNPGAIDISPERAQRAIAAASDDKAGDE